MSEWWTWDLDLPSESTFLSTVRMLHLIGCVGYHWYIHLCNSVWVILHFGWGNVLDFRSRKMSMACLYLQEPTVSWGNSHWTAEYKELQNYRRVWLTLPMMKTGGHQVNFWEEKCLDLAGKAREEGIPGSKCNMYKMVVCRWLGPSFARTWMPSEWI